MCGAVGCGQQRQLSTTADKGRAAKFLLPPMRRDRQPSLRPSAEAGRAVDGLTPAVSGCRAID